MIQHKGVTFAEYPQFVSASMGMGPCLCVEGYNPEERISIIAHSPDEEELARRIDESTDYVREVKGEDIPYDFTLIGGEKNPEVIDAAKAHIERKFPNSKIAYEDTEYVGNEKFGKSLARNTRTGELYSLNYSQREQIPVTEDQIYETLVSNHPNNDS
jgi:hypothetical protein